MELQEELAAATEEIAHCTVSITGRDGIHLYAKATFEDGSPTHQSFVWLVPFFSPRTRKRTVFAATTCSLITALKDVEIRVDGKGKRLFGEGRVQYGCFDGIYDTSTRRCAVF
jgi:hypothetical protein